MKLRTSLPYRESKMAFEDHHPTQPHAGGVPLNKAGPPWPGQLWRRYPSPLICSHLPREAVLPCRRKAEILKDTELPMRCFAMAGTASVCVGDALLVPMARGFCWDRARLLCGVWVSCSCSTRRLGPFFASVQWFQTFSCTPLHNVSSFLTTGVHHFVQLLMPS